MCGITGYCGNGREVGKYLYNSLKRLEYRGYDSAGAAAIADGRGMNVRKGEGEIGEINRRLKLEEMEGDIAMGHVRWATHGGVSKKNAHPHLDCKGRFAIIHNGIIENWEELKDELSDHEFTSDTDSEVIAHFIEEHCEDGDVENAVRRFMKRAEGSFAAVLMDAEGREMYAFKRGSPLVLGVGDGENFLGSDIYAFSTETNRAIFFEDDEYAVIDRGGYAFKDVEGNPVEKEPREFEWNREESEKGEHEHYMRKEIGEIPRAIERLEASLETTQREKLERLAEAVEEHDRVLFTASGTSYHASLLGVFFLHRLGVDAQTLIASEFKNYERVDEDTLVVPISQSGETKDVIDAIEFSKSRGAEIASIVNVPYSTIERESDISIRIEAGQEVCVAATKTFINQLYLLLKLAQRLGYETELSQLPGQIERLLDVNEPKVEEVAKELAENDDVYIIGRGITYPVAREIALKLKEIAYIHAEGMMGGELKHGTLALIEDGTPVISLIPERNSEIKSNVKEVEARGARSIKISPWEGEFDLPDIDSTFAFYSTIIGFLLTYWIAEEKNLSIDKPRNLSKCVSVK